MLSFLYVLWQSQHVVWIGSIFPDAFLSFAISLLIVRWTFSFFFLLPCKYNCQMQSVHCCRCGNCTAGALRGLFADVQNICMYTCFVWLRLCATQTSDRIRKQLFTAKFPGFLLSLLQLLHQRSVPNCGYVLCDFLWALCCVRAAAQVCSVTSNFYFHLPATNVLTAASGKK